MKSFLKNVLSTIVGIVLSVVVVVLLFIGIISIAVSSLDNEGETKVKMGSILKISLDKEIVERASDNPLDYLSLANMEMNIPDELKTILDNIEKAKTDDRIKGIYLNVPFLNAGLSQTEEIRNKLLDFKTSGKFIVSYAEYYSQKGYYLSSVADELYLNPEGMFELKGFSAQIMFYKGLLEKLDVEVQVIRHGKFKSAIEPFVLDKMSRSNREQISLLLSTISDNIMDSIASQRGLTLSKVEELANKLELTTAEKCLENHFVDALIYQDELEEKLKSKLGEETKLEFISLTKYKNAKVEKEGKISRDKIAIIYATGEINSGKGDLKSIGSVTTAKAIKQAREDKRVKAIVLRVNSPGGSALASDVIWRETVLAKAEKPLVISMGDLAASGGYYIACAANTIVANPTTITGSIGVFGLIPNMKHFYKNKLGITIDTVNTSKHADFGGMHRRLTSFERAKIQDHVEDIYATFISHVAEGRNMSTAAVDDIGQGRVWTGYDAKRLGLVDVLGGLETAIDIAADLAELSDYRLVSLPKKENPLETFIKEITGEESKYIANYLGIDRKFVKSVENLLKGEKIKARMPFILEIN
ncbi:MAG TPA: signal peptide peptidase SppA [Flavobacteriales bacterium]|nr:signal peptide peptidase SppA [Flavobacteriales bacterium]HIL66674.1 signal peptide peptidase SppA [Flavobacteriales bacterium]